MTKRKITKKELQRVQPPMTEAFEQRMLHTIDTLPQVREETIVKKKISSSVVLALVLVLALATVALAVAYWRDTGEQVAALEAENGYFDAWPTEKKVELVRILNDAGELPDNTEVSALLAGLVDEPTMDKTATRIISEWSGQPIDAVSLYSILEKLNGPFSGWSAEDKAWYTETLKKYGMYTAEDIAYEIPKTTDISEAEAIRIGKAALAKEYDVSVEYLDRFTADAAFITPSWEIVGITPGEQIWNIEFTLTANENGEDVLYVYMIEMKRDGTILGHARNNPHSFRADFDNLMQNRGAFYEWTMEEQASYTEMLPSMIAEAQAKGEEVDGYILALGALRFGFPSELDMTKEQAIDTAEVYVKEHYGATDEGLQKLQPYVSFDITDPDQSIWRVKLMPWLIESYENYESTGYIVHIQARTGDVVKSLNRPDDSIHATDLF